MFKKNNFFITVLISLLTILVFMLFENSSNAVPPKKNLLPSDYHTGVNWKDAQLKNKPIALLFYVNWCNACRKFAPIFDNYGKEYKSKYNFVIVQADKKQNYELAKQYKIRSYPSVYLIDKTKNKEIYLPFKIYFNEDEFKQELDSFLNSDELPTE